MAASGFASTLGPLNPSGPAGVDLRPQRPGGLGLGTVLALVAHALLVLALALGVQWRTAEPEGVSAELWAAVPQVAAPPAPPQTSPQTPPQPKPEPPAVKVPAPPPVAPTPPQVNEAQIAVEKAKAERERKDLAEREKAEKDKADKLKADKAEAERLKVDKAEKAAAEKLMKEQAEEQRLAKLREDNLRRMMGQAGGAVGTGAPGSTGTAARDAGPSAGYAGRIKARVKPNITLTDEVAGNPVAEVEVRLAPDGTIVGRTLKKSSGATDWDEAVLRAIDKTETLPRDTDGRVPPSLIISFRPKD